MKTITYGQAISEALREEMLRDDNVFILGEDMAVMGSVFGLTKGFLEEFGENRVIDTPISEAGFTAMAVGAALRGLRPVVEIMYVDFTPVCFDAIVNQAAKMRYMTGGQTSVPLVIRCPGGAGRRNAGQHSQSLEALFTHIPGLKVIAPSTPADMKGLLKAAIRDDDPVICIEHKLLYAAKGEVPEGEHLIPLGSAAVRRPGRDVTVIAWSRQVHSALEAAKTLAAEGIDAEVIDLRSLVPLDWETLASSVRKTHRAVIVHEAVKRGGYGGELAAQIGEDLFDSLDAPVKRVAGLNVVPPFSPALEDFIYPNPGDIAAAVRETLGR
ncbi:alpha-ketoacid dehydrogenase subunit beta [Anaeroselena agilis]|uniref:Alpha-ketoacid dehydrogenase subunit beta n=1 Tax=Anaeroselena agilis TaxID=3063788 RepID=A0ABU3NXX3_9FIRM|nr:alpha-ketoacid dehydrogenase subunit beta [Selenomonadales bacterium 4137-cl]